MLTIIFSLFALIASLAFIADSNVPILNGFFGNILLLVVVISILFFIYLFVVRIIHWIEIICKDPNPSEKINISDALRNEDILQCIKIALGGGIFLIAVNFVWDTFFQKTYICKDKGDKIYFLVLSVNGSSFIYDNNGKYVSSSKYYNIRDNRFIGENGWEGWPGTENNSMVVQYRDKDGALKEFYHGCLLKKSYF